MKQKKSKPETYGTRQIADILDIPEWRVKNFTEGAAYRLPPGVRAGKGRGSRRLYDWEDIFRIGLADRLVKFGFTPEVVGRAVREVPESLFTFYKDFSRDPNKTLKDTETPLLVNENGVWKLRMANEVLPTLKQTLEHEGTARGLFVINVANVCDAIFGELQRYWTGMTKAEAQAELKAIHSGE